MLADPAGAHAPKTTALCLFPRRKSYNIMGNTQVRNTEEMLKPSIFSILTLYLYLEYSHFVSLKYA